MTTNTKIKLEYQSGFGNDFQSQALPGALPVGQNSPQKPKYGLYAEQLNGTSFLAQRQENLRSWLYRIKPSVYTGKGCKVDYPNCKSRPFSTTFTMAVPYRFDPIIKLAESAIDFLTSLKTVCGNGDLASYRGSCVHLYGFNKALENEFFYNCDGDFLFVPYLGEVLIQTEFGHLTVGPGQIANVPRGIRYNVVNLSPFCAGYILENYGRPFQLPYLGPIGSNGLANPRDFLYPVAKFEDKSGDYKVVTKFSGQFTAHEIDYHPLNVVAFHGNYLPYKYDLSLFNVINTVSFDHCDPSIFTVLTSPSEISTYSNVDFVIFPPRWLVSEGSFQPAPLITSATA